MIKYKIAMAVYGIIAGMALLELAGTIGALDADAISNTRFFIQAGVGLAMLFIGTLGYGLNKDRQFNKKYGRDVK